MLVRQKSALKLVRCLELPSAELEDVAAVLLPTFVYVEDNLGGRAEKLLLCGFGAQAGRGAAALPAKNWASKWSRCARRSALPGENNAGLLGYLRSIARNN